MKIDIEARLFRRIKKTTGCWHWAGTIQHQGYGRIQVDGKDFLAHRLSYSVFVGPIANGNVIHHKCGNKGCVRPDHLASVTSRENTIAYHNEGRKKPKQVSMIRGEAYAF